MDDIYDIKDLEVFIGGEFIFYPIFFLFFIFFFYIFLKNFFLNKNNSKNGNTNSIEEKVSEKFEYIIMDKLLKLELKSKTLEKSVFYFELNKIFRTYLGFLYDKNFLKSTLDEIKLEGLLSKKLNGNNIITLFELSYNEEFSDMNDSLAKRKKILNDFIELLK